MNIKTITIKKKGGGTRQQKVQVLKSGKYKFIKNTTKGMVRKTRKAGRRAYEKVKTKTKPKKKANNSNSSTSKRSNMKGFKVPSIAKKAALGIGGAAIATAIVSLIAPNSSVAKLAAPAGAFALGGLEGVIGSFAMNMLGGNLASNTNSVVVPRVEVL